MRIIVFFFFFNDTATTEIYTLSLHDALPIFRQLQCVIPLGLVSSVARIKASRFSSSYFGLRPRDRKSTRLNSSHSQISYAVFCLKKKKKFYVSLCTSSEVPLPSLTCTHCSSY